MQNLLTVDYMACEQAYIISPIHSHDEYVFFNYMDAKRFIEAWFYNPIAAVYAYHQTAGAM